MSSHEKSRDELLRELETQRKFVHALDTMIANQIAQFLKHRTTHVLEIFKIKKLLGIKKIRDVSVEKDKLTRLEEVVKKLGLPRPMLTSFFRSVFRYARWVQSQKKSAEK